MNRHHSTLRRARHAAPRASTAAIAPIESLESRRLMASVTWSDYAKLVNQDDALKAFPSITGKGQTVAVIDTGVDYSLDALGGGFGKGHKVVAGYDFYANDADPMDESGHGTNVAGMIAAKSYTVGGVTYQGIAPDAQIAALRIGTESNISYARIEKALDWVLDNHDTYNIHVVNLSLGSSSFTDAETDDTLSDEFAKLHDLGIFVVAASGNSNDVSSGPISEDGIAYPAADPNVFAVGAVDSSDVITTWSQRGDELDLLAPGDDVVLPKLGGGTETTSGTSFSSPMVAGVAALMYQLDPSLTAGDVGSILMTSGTNNRDGDKETGNTTTLQYSRLDIAAALNLVAARTSSDTRINLGTNYDTALDNQGVLHVAFYDSSDQQLKYVTRSLDGRWSDPVVVDSAKKVGYFASIAVDNTGKIGISYYDSTNANLKYASFNGQKWSTATVDSKKSVGTYTSVAFDIDGNAYIAYYKKSGGTLKMATLDRDSGDWSVRTVDSSADVGTHASIDLGETPVRRQGFFTTYDTFVAIAYADNTNGNLKYARVDLDDSTATWYVATIDDMRGVSQIDLDLHAGPTSSGMQAQIAYQDYKNQDVKYAYKFQETGVPANDWKKEKVAASGQVGGSVQLAFNTDDLPVVTYYNATKKAVYQATRSNTTGIWSGTKIATSSGYAAVSFNERSGEAVATWLNRTKKQTFSDELV